MADRRLGILAGICVLGVGAGCRDHLTLHGEPLVLESVTVGQPDAVQGETAVEVTLRVANPSTFRQTVEVVSLQVSIGGNDRSSEFLFEPVVSGPAEIPAETVVDLAYLLTVSDEATAGSASVNATITTGSGAEGTAPVPATLLVLRHAALSVVAQTVDGATCRDSRVATLRLRVRNDGESDAIVGAATAVVLRGASDVTAEFLVAPAGTNGTTLVPAQESDLDVFLGSDAATALGAVDARVVVDASDARSGIDASPAPSATSAVDVHERALLAVTTVSENRVNVSKGQTALVVSATVTNAGTVPATLETGSLSFLRGATPANDDYTVTPPASGAVVAAGGTATRDFTVVVKATATSGATTIGAAFTAADAICEESPTTTAATAPGAWTVQTPPILVASVTSSVAEAWAGDATTVTLTVQNVGEADAAAVAPSIAVAVCPTCAALTAVDTTAKNIAASASAMFSWTAALSVPLPDGQDIADPRFDASGAGTDVNTLGAVSSGTSSDTSTVEALRPVACFESTPTATGKSGTDPFDVDASCSFDVETADAQLDVDWDWSDDGTFDDTGLTESHDYSSAGKKSAVVRVTDAHGREGFLTRTLVVETNGDIGCVTTAVDEDDAGATPTSPGGGGFSLREAIDWATSNGGRQTICFDESLAGGTITFTRGVLPILPSGGVYLAGRRDITIDFENLPYGFRTRTDSEFYRLRLTGVADAVDGGIAKIVVGSSSVDIEDCEIFGGGGAGIAWDETLSTAVVTDLDVVSNDIHDNETDGIRLLPVDPNDVEAEILYNRIHENGGSGIDAGGIGNGVVIGRNLLYGNDSHGLVIGGDDADIVNNTIALNGADGIRFEDCGCGTNNNFWNNLVYGNGGVGLDAIAGTTADSLGTNYVFDNDGGDTTGSPADLALSASDEIGSLDPELTMAFTLSRTSPCRNGGQFLAGSPDANDTDSGNFYGGAVDVGAWESPR